MLICFSYIQYLLFEVNAWHTVIGVTVLIFTLPEKEYGLRGIVTIMMALFKQVHLPPPRTLLAQQRFIWKEIAA